YNRFQPKAAAGRRVPCSSNAERAGQAVRRGPGDQRSAIGLEAGGTADSCADMAPTRNTRTEGGSQTMGEEVGTGTASRHVDSARFEEIQRQGFSGPAWSALCGDLFAYGEGVLISWLRDRSIYRRCEQ